MECKLRLLPTGRLEKYNGVVQVFLFPYGGSQAITLENGLIITELYARKCKYKAEIASTVGQTSNHFSLSYGEKASVLYGYYERARLDCTLPKISAKTSQCAGKQIGNMFARDMLGNTNAARRKMMKSLRDGEQAYMVDKLQFSMPVLCHRLQTTWTRIMKSCLR